MMEDKILHSVKWTDTEELRVGISSFKSKQYFYARIWYTEDNGKTWKPGRQGFNIHLEDAEELVDALTKGLELYELTEGA